MTQNTLSSDDQAADPQAAPAIGTQLLAFSSAASVGVALFFSSILVGVAMFVLVLFTMNVDAGSGWVTRLRETAEDRNCRLLLRVLSQQ